MRRYQKKAVNDCIHALCQAHEAVRQTMNSENPLSAQGLLSQCQEVAIQLGTMLEEIMGEGYEAVKMLEDYCELVFQIYTLLTQGHMLNPENVYRQLEERMARAEERVNQEKERLEVVFLPYKAAMWDSLESVWKAAAEDPDCDAYVIPIPYYDRNPDGSFREEHYEGDLYPDSVPITRYDEYDFQNRRPDLIFIHNPYDDCNYLTSVHPFFYSKNLKNFTEKLVYIPYFILGEIDPDNKEAVEGMAHFCTLPGVLYADRTIVQSEDMRQIYVNVLTEFAKGTGADQAYWEEKILGLGSPKIDKAVNTRKEDVEVPEEWLPVIEKADGSWKKIIFYNTGLTALLQNGEKMLTKMRDVFRVFKENREEVALLWRPHPLIQTTFRTMRPHLWGEYKEILETYLEEGWGIYDDTPDLDRAIALSDAYYGDGSSVVQLCQSVGMPVMIQDVEIV